MLVSIFIVAVQTFIESIYSLRL